MEDETLSISMKLSRLLKEGNAKVDELERKTAASKDKQGSSKIFTLSDFDQMSDKLLHRAS